ncbi:MAG: superoxide dismutase [Bacteroidia bacterium]
MENNRRDFLKKSALLGLLGIGTKLIGKENIQQLENFSNNPTTDSFTLPPLPYGYGGLEPFIDKQTMEIHHTKHHQGYINKLNAAIGKDYDFSISDEEKCKSVNDKTSLAVRNNLGGYYNHKLFWAIMRPNPEGYHNIAEGKLAKEIQSQFSSFENFQKEFSDKASKVFGSGWCWLIVNSKGKLEITTTANQDNPLMSVSTVQGTPILCLDVWEHAYYLKYQNKRADYIKNWWVIVNWPKVEELYLQLKK